MRRHREPREELSSLENSLVSESRQMHSRHIMQRLNVRIQWSAGVFGEDDLSAGSLGLLTGGREREQGESIYSTLAWRGHTGSAEASSLESGSLGLKLCSIFMILRASLNLSETQFLHTRIVGRFITELCSAFSTVACPKQAFNCQQLIISWWHCCYNDTTMLRRLRGSASGLF